MDKKDKSKRKMSQSQWRAFWGLHLANKQKKTTKIKKQKWDESVKDTPEYDVKKYSKQAEKLQKQIAILKMKQAKLGR